MIKVSLISSRFRQTGCSLCPSISWYLTSSQQETGYLNLQSHKPPLKGLWLLSLQERKEICFWGLFERFWPGTPRLEQHRMNWSRMNGVWVLLTTRCFRCVIDYIPWQLICAYDSWTPMVTNTEKWITKRRPLTNYHGPLFAATHLQPRDPKGSSGMVSSPALWMVLIIQTTLATVWKLGYRSPECQHGNYYLEIDRCTVCCLFLEAHGIFFFFSWSYNVSIHWRYVAKNHTRHVFSLPACDPLG